ncbi:hypothetical protein ACHHYP_02426 [Achlya hypogyna]|uniref:EF-hand domain-containing protein n=1 Tax=Achlya hypogyna TaxID=1202772 RepID=A0A1V9Z6K7_ACHHY|nr:hypothetical protein ACHHYP_02426 [Achlya hypogyna]
MTSHLRVADADEILARLRSQFHAKGTQQLADLGSYFERMDRDQTGQLVRKEAETAFNYFGLFPTSQELGTIMRFFGSTQGSSTFLYWKLFLRALAGDMNPLRQEAVRLAFETVQGGAVADLSHLGRFEQHPLALRGVMTAEDLRDAFAVGLGKAQADANNAVTWEAFETYYASVSLAFPTDDDFVAMISGVWDPVGLRKVAKPIIFGGKNDELLQKLEQRTHKEETPRDVLLRTFRKYDASETGFVTESELAKTCEVLGLIVTPEEVRETFKSGQKDGRGKLSVVWFANFICNDS